MIHRSKMRDLPATSNLPSSYLWARSANEHAPIVRMPGIRALPQNRIPPPQRELRDVKGECTENGAGP